MTEYMIVSNSEEINDIFRGDKRYIIRPHKDVMKKGDRIRFRLFKNQKEIYHQINRKTYEVTKVEDWTIAPIHKYWKIISFKES